MKFSKNNNVHDNMVEDKDGTQIGALRKQDN